MSLHTYVADSSFFVILAPSNLEADHAIRQTPYTDLGKASDDPGQHHEKGRLMSYSSWKSRGWKRQGLFGCTRYSTDGRFNFGKAQCTIRQEGVHFRKKGCRLFLSEDPDVGVASTSRDGFNSPFYVAFVVLYRCIPEWQQPGPLSFAWGSAAFTSRGMWQAMGKYMLTRNSCHLD